MVWFVKLLVLRAHARSAGPRGRPSSRSHMQRVAMAFTLVALVVPSPPDAMLGSAGDSGGRVVSLHESLPGGTLCMEASIRQLCSSVSRGTCCNVVTAEYA